MYENHHGYWYKYTYDENGNELSVEASDGSPLKYTYNENGDILRTECSDRDGENVFTTKTETLKQKNSLTEAGLNT